MASWGQEVEPKPAVTLASGSSIVKAFELCHRPVYQGFNFKVPCARKKGHAGQCRVDTW